MQHIAHLPLSLALSIVAHAVLLFSFPLAGKPAKPIEQSFAGLLEVEVQKQARLENQGNQHLDSALTNSSQAVLSAPPSPPTDMAGQESHQQEPRYFSPEEVDTQAEVLNSSSQSPPPETKEKELEGSALIKVFIGAEGEVDHIEVIERKYSSEYHDVFLARLRQVRFLAAIRKGHTVASWQVLEIAGLPPP